LANVVALRVSGRRNLFLSKEAHCCRASRRSNHQPRARWLTDRLWSAELRRLSNGHPIPFGSSGLLVFEKR